MIQQSGNPGPGNRFSEQGLAELDSIDFDELLKGWRNSQFITGITLGSFSAWAALSTWLSTTRILCLTRSQLLRPCAQTPDETQARLEARQVLRIEQIT